MRIFSGVVLDCVVRFSSARAFGFQLLRLWGLFAVFRVFCFSLSSSGVLDFLISNCVFVILICVTHLGLLYWFVFLLSFSVRIIGFREF